MRTLKLLSFLLFVLVFLYACSNIKEPLQANPEPETEVHPAGWLNKNSPDFHGVFIRNTGWNLQNCRQCHAADYTGGIAEVSCLTCHPATPEDCIVCHGGVDNLSGAPPEDLEGNVDNRSQGVGAHTIHLEGGPQSSGFECQTCHIVPGSFAAQGHIDADSHAEITFHALAVADGAQPAWDSDSEACANSYCHGNWSLSKSASGFASLYIADAITGNLATPEWTDPASVACESCHGLPPTGHAPFELAQCSICHTVTLDDTGSILDKSKHVNGKVNVFQQEYPMF